MPSNCSKAWVCANISRRSARMASVPWWSGFAPTLVPRSLQPLSGAARTSVLRPLGQLSGSLHGPRNDWPAPERQRPYQILKAPADGAGRPGNNLCLRIARGLSWNNPVGCSSQTWPSVASVRQKNSNCKIFLRKGTALQLRVLGDNYSPLYKLVSSLPGSEILILSRSCSRRRARQHRHLLVDHDRAGALSVRGRRSRRVSRRYPRDAAVVPPARARLRGSPWKTLE
jgi:hypothetical protein